MNQSTFLKLLVIALLWGIMIISYSEHDDLDVSEAQYCEMVEIWENESHMPQADRAGWPPYKGLEGCK